MKISVVIITLNEAQALPKTLEAVAWADEVVIVDSGSTDNTLAIAQAQGCRVFTRKFDGYGPQKNFGIAQTQHNWVLSIDADEVVSPELGAEIIRTLQNPKKHGYYVPISLVFLGKLLRFCGEYKMPHLRLFNKNFGQYNANQVHEGIVLNGTAGYLKNHALHQSYTSIHNYFEKFNHYTTRGATLLSRNMKRSSIWPVVTRFPLTFLKIYLLKFGFLDGYAGFVWALFSAMYPVVKYAKLREMQERSEEE